MTELSSPFCVLFDLDGTLIDTAPGLAATMNVLLARRGRPSLNTDALRPCISHGAKAIISHAMEMTGEPAGASLIDQMFDEFLTHYRAHMAKASLPYPGVAECLDALTGAGYRLGVCTNRYEISARELLNALQLSSYFGCITGQDSFGAAKPDPTPVTQTLKALGGDAGHAAFVGDSEIDVAAARASGLPVIVTSFGYGSIPVPQMNADAVIGHFDELHPLVRKMRLNDTKPLKS